MMRDFKYFTLAPHGVDESTQQYKFEGGIEAVGSPPAVNLEYRFVYDPENEESGASDWQPYSVGDTITLTTDPWFGVQFRNDSGNFSNSSSNYYHIKSIYAFNAGGKIISLINYTDESATLQNYAFYSLFKETKIHDSHELILLDRVSDNCYQNMFYSCSSLQAAPALPATTLASSCYNQMFMGCTSLTTAPELPATTLASYCYNNMFRECTSLTSAPALPATTLASNCYNRMFANCTSLTSAPALPATTLASSCYREMFNGCSSLTSAPELPATTLAEYCYNQMFMGCTSLTKPPSVLPATSAGYCCCGDMFNNCTSLTIAPEMPPATNLSRICYQYMFVGCKKIDHIVWKSTTIPSSTYCSNWLSGTSASGKFEYTDPTLDVASIERGTSGVPAGWSISLLSPETKLLLKINNASVGSISLLGKKIASLSINGKKVKSSSAA